MSLWSNALSKVYVQSDSYLRVTMLSSDQTSGLGGSFEYDSANNLVGREYNGQVRLEGGNESSPGVVEIAWTYGADGNMLTEQYAGEPAATYTYCGADRYFQKATAADPEGRVTSFDYFLNDDASPGKRGQPKWVRDARYGTTGEQWEYTYNTYGQKLTETNLNNVVTEYTYGDAWGNLTQTVQDPGWDT
jgi:YD repeat-containing protein